MQNSPIRVDDIIETQNHFRAVDYLIDTCLASQDAFKAVLDYFRID